MQRVEKAREEVFLTVEEVATLLTLRPVTIDRWCHAGRLSNTKDG